MSSGTVRTLGVCGVYWSSSNISVRAMTAPGVTAMSVPTSKASGSTIDGTRGGVAKSRTKRRPPATRLPPPVSMTRLSTLGLRKGLLLGAEASTRLSTMKPIRWSSPQSSSASSTSPRAASPRAR